MIWLKMMGVFAIAVCVSAQLPVEALEHAPMATLGGILGSAYIAGKMLVRLVDYKLGPRSVNGMGETLKEMRDTSNDMRDILKSIKSGQNANLSATLAQISALGKALEKEQEHTLKAIERIEQRLTA